MTLEAEQIDRLPEFQTEEERIQGALLTMQDTWLHDLLDDDFEITEEWIESFNAVFKVAAVKLDGHNTFNQASTVKSARSVLYSEFANKAKNDNLQKAFLKFQQISQPPLILIENARLMASFNLNAGHIMMRSQAITRLETSVLLKKIQHNIQLYGEDEAIKVMQRAPRRFLDMDAKNQERNTRAFARTAAIMGIEGVSEAADLTSEIVRHGLAKSLAIARIALEFSENIEANLRQANVELTQPLDAHMLAILSEGAFTLGKSVWYRRSVPPEERRKRVLHQLTPAGCGTLGARVLRAYFRVQPLTESEVKRYPRLAKLQTDRFREYDRPFVDADAIIYEDDMKILEDAALSTDKINDPEWIRYMNHLIRRGSRDARAQKRLGANNPTIRARHQFLDELGWTDEAHPLHKQVERVLARQPNAVSPALIMRTLRFTYESGIDYVRFCKNFPAIVPGDIGLIKARRDIMLEIFTTAGRAEDSRQLLNKFAGYFAHSEQNLTSLSQLTKLYQQRLGKQLTDSQLRHLFMSSPEAHVLAIRRDGAIDPKVAFELMLHMSRPQLRESMHEFLVNQAMSIDN